MKIRTDLNTVLDGMPKALTTHHNKPTVSDELKIVENAHGNVPLLIQRVSLYPQICLCRIVGGKIQIKDGSRVREERSTLLT